MNQVPESWWKEDETGRFLTGLLNGKLSVIPFERAAGKYWVPACYFTGRAVQTAIYREFRRRAEAVGKRVFVRRKRLHPEWISRN